MRRLLKNVGFWIIIAMLIGVVVGVAMGPEAAMFKPLGDLFIQLIKMLVVPLVLVSIISGAAALGETKSAGLVGGISIGYMLITTVISVSLALLLGIVFEPGAGIDRDKINAQIAQNEGAPEIDIRNIGEQTIEFAFDEGEAASASWVVYSASEAAPTNNYILNTGTAIDFDAEHIAIENLASGSDYMVSVVAVVDGEIERFDSAKITTNVPPMGFWDTIIGMIPDNPIRALANGDILQIIIFGLFFGFGVSALAAEKRRKVVGGLNVILEALIWCISKVMYVAPFGVFGLIADAAGTFGFDILMQVANVLWLDLLAVAIIGLGLYPLTIYLFSKVPLRTYFRAMIKPQVVSFSTASSLATLPVNMEACTEMGVSKHTSGFVLPLGATINMSGNAIYYALLAVFFAQFYGIELGMGEYISIAVVCTLGAIGQAGVPGPTLLVAAVLVAAGIPLEGLPLFYALDRIFDMIRTTLNITGDAACAAVVDRFVNKPQPTAEK